MCGKIYIYICVFEFYFYFKIYSERKGDLKNYLFFPNYIVLFVFIGSDHITRIPRAVYRRHPRSRRGSGIASACVSTETNTWCIEPWNRPAREGRGTPRHGAQSLRKHPAARSVLNKEQGQNATPCAEVRPWLRFPVTSSFSGQDRTRLLAPLSPVYQEL